MLLRKGFIKYEEEKMVPQCVHEGEFAGFAVFAAGGGSFLRGDVCVTANAGASGFGLGEGVCRFPGIC